MADENTTSDSSTDQSVTDGQQNNGTDNAGSGATPPAAQDQNQSTDGGQDGTNTDTQSQQDQKDPAKSGLLADLHKERKDRQSAQSRVTELETEITTLKTKAETVDSIQHKYERLEAFLQSAGGALGRALDSRSFTEALFESDKDVADIVADWNKNNPSNTSTALGAGAAQPSPKGPTMNDLLRSASK
uniref:Scaffolding protein n=1 Tax=Micrococcus phage Olihed TaxID=3092209 RepID=A0AAU6R5X7_9CAUD